MLSTDHPDAEAHFRGLPGVRSVLREGGSVTIDGTGERLVTDVIGCVSEHRIHVSEFRTVLPSLEDVFLRLTGHRIRD